MKICTKTDRKLWGCVAVISVLVFVTTLADFTRAGTGLQQQPCSDHGEKLRSVRVGDEIYWFPDDIRLRNMSLEPYSVQLPAQDIQKEYLRLLGHLELECRHAARLGSYTDGGWHVCLVPPYQLRPPCLVYDFGIARRWSFDDAISTEYGCKVRAFDPTCGLPEHNRSRLIQFYPVGLWGSEGLHERGFPVRTLHGFLQQFREQNTTIDVLKLDIEGSEWAALRTMLGDGSLRLVKQLAVEVHVLADTPRVAFTEYTTVLKDLRAAGFRLWRDDWNTKNIMYSKHLGYQTACHEQYFLNINFLK